MSVEQRRAQTANARSAVERKYLDLVDPTHELSEDERQRRAKAARSADLDRIREKGSRTRRQQGEEAIEFRVRIIPGEHLDPAQLSAWRRLWGVLLRPADELEDGAAADA